MKIDCLSSGVEYLSRLAVSKPHGKWGFLKSGEAAVVEPCGRNVGTAEPFLDFVTRRRVTRTSTPTESTALTAKGHPVAKASPAETARFRTGLMLFFIHLLSEAARWSTRYCNKRAQSLSLQIKKVNFRIPLCCMLL